MSVPTIKTRIPDRAIASVFFACFTIFVRRIAAQLEWLPMRLDGIPEQALSQFGPIMGSLQIAYETLAVATLVWCIWSWFTEHRVPAVIATIFTVLALFDAFFVR
jgi:hypothetical protein